MSDQTQETKPTKFDPKAPLEVRTAQAKKHYKLTDDQILAIVDTPALRRPNCPPGTLALVTTHAQKCYYPPLD